ncbi:2-oxo acid dehydrogenase subunit E2, partial [Jatrophihabitans sp.]|uniref:2-oxo acid dehydrogenase subunit E2 n=1 Tax=Jatrophihabitans sp. TaxID=1932789 RepID=UPI0038CD3C77
MYERYLADPSAVDAAWHDFFADYRPAAGPAGSVRHAPPGTSYDDLDADAEEVGAGMSDTGASQPAPATADGRHQASDQTAQSGTGHSGTDQSGTGPSGTGPSAAGQSGTGQSGTGQSGTSPSAAAQNGSAPTGTTQSDPPPSRATERPAAEAPSTPPARPAASAPAAPPAAKPSWTQPTVAPLAAAEAHVTVLRGAPAKVVTNMQASLEIPTATSVRAVPAKLLGDNRIIINNHLRRARGGKVSFTHLIGYAVVRALRDFPEMNNFFALNAEGKPVMVQPEHVNLGLAIDLPGKDGGRSLVVASIKSAETMDFASFWGAYEDIIRRARSGKLAADDFAGTTVSLTNPGTIGTNHSVPRLMQGQGTIIGVGAMEYPAEFSGMNPDALNDMGISRTMTLTSTYDHRIIQGAQSGEFLRRVHQLLLGEDNFYYDIFASLRIPYEPAVWLTDREFSHEGQIDKAARVIELINAYRSSGHLMADTDPLEFKIRTHPDLDITKHGLTL